MTLRRPTCLDLLEKPLPMFENKDREEVNEKNIVENGRPQGGLIQSRVTVGARTEWVEVLNAILHVQDEIIAN